jgi:hypothetical protein
MEKWARYKVLWWVVDCWELLGLSVCFVMWASVSKEQLKMPKEIETILFSKASRRLWGPPSSYLLNGCRGSFLGVKRPGCEVSHLPQSSVEVKTWSNTSTPLYAVMRWTGKTLPLILLFTFATSCGCLGSRVRRKDRNKPELFAFEGLFLTGK